MDWLNTSPLVKLYTLEEFWRLPDPPERFKIELIAGVLYLTPPPEYTHDDAVKRLNRLLTAHLIAIGDRGSLYVPRAAIWTEPNTHLEPDFFYLLEERERTLDPKHRTTADLVVEVVSPGSAIYDRNTKADTYWALGVRELWLVDETAGIVEVRTRGAQRFETWAILKRGDRLTSTVITGLDLQVRRIFED
jgi:Uma2 family endonuclease